MFTTALEVRRLARERGLKLEAWPLVACTGCGASAEMGAVLLLGLGHWPDCDADYEQIAFRRKPNA